MDVTSRFSLTGKTAIVTGGAQGIGRAIAQGFAEAGANVVIAGFNVWKPAETAGQLEAAVADLKKLGAKAIGIVTDMAVKADVERAAERTLKEFGRVDVLVNNVGGARGGAIYSPFLDLTEEAFDLSVRENLKTTFLGCRVVGAIMAKQRSGAIVNISSMDALGPARHRAHYAAAKAGVISLTQTISAELASYNVRANAIAPYYVQTEGLQQFFEQNPAKRDQVVSTIPLGKVGKPEDIAAIALFLASDASSYITGQTFVPSGGALVPDAP